MPSPRTNRELLFIHSFSPRARQLALDELAGTASTAPPTPAELGRRLEALERALAQALTRLAELEASLRRRRA